MLTTSEKKLIHIYARAANLSDQEYRALLLSVTGLRSSADPEFSHADADRVLLALETVLDQRVSLGVVARPRSNWIRDLQHFRRRRHNRLSETARPLHLARRYWLLLQTLLPPAQRSPTYLSGILARACCRPVSGLSELTPPELTPALAALRDRLTYALRRQKN
jgi:hypothetical protein